MSLSDLLREKTGVAIKRGTLADRALAAKGVGRSSEWKRISTLPRRVLDPAAVDLTPIWLIPNADCPGCDLCRDPDGHPRQPRLRPIQSAVLLEAERVGGLYAPVGVGHGKELACLLLPDALQARRAVILTEARLKSQMLDVDLPRYGRHFRLPLDRIVGVVSYSELSSTSKGDVLERLDPDAFICNEAHTLENDSVRSERFWREADARPDAPVCFLSGTLGSKGVKRSRRLPARSLRALSHVPRSFHEADDWGRAVDPNPEAGADPIEPGALLDLCGPADLEGEISKLSHEEQQLFVSDHSSALTVRRLVAWRIFRRRATETPGVVATSGASVDCRLMLRGRTMPESAPVAAALAELRKLWSVGGQDLVDAKEVARFAKQLYLGFYYRWVWPNGKDQEWLDARAAWRGFQRDWLSRRSRSGCDSPELLRRAVERGEVQSAEYAAWLAVADRYRPEPPKETVWLDRELVWRDVERAVGEGAGPLVVWYDHRAVGEKLASRGLPVFRAGSEGDQIVEFRGPACAASIAAHGTGKNLQHFRRGLVLTPPSSNGRWEQLLGRWHRAGQRAEEVECAVHVGDRALRNALCAAWREAWRDTETKEPQRLYYADKVGLDFVEEDERCGG